MHTHAPKLSLTHVNSSANVLENPDAPQIEILKPPVDAGTFNGNHATVNSIPDNEEEDQLDSSPHPSKSKHTKRIPTRAANSASPSSTLPPGPKKPRLIDLKKQRVEAPKIKSKPASVRRPETCSQSTVTNVVPLSLVPGPEATAPVAPFLPAVGEHAKPGPQSSKALSLNDLPMLPSSDIFKVFTSYFLHVLSIIQLVFLCSSHSVVFHAKCRTRKVPPPVSLQGGVSPAITVP